MIKNKTNKQKRWRNKIQQKRGNCECIATWRSPDVALVVLGCFWLNLYSHAQKMLFPASDQNSDIAVRFSNPNFPCHPAPFLPVRLRLSTILCKFAHKIFFLRVSPPGGCHPGRSAPPSDATADFPEESNKSAITRRFHAVTLTFDTWPWSL